MNLRNTGIINYKLINPLMYYGPLQTVLAVKALGMDSSMPHSFLHQIVCDVVNESKQLTKAERV